VPNLGRRFKHGCLEDAAILDRPFPVGRNRISTCITPTVLYNVNIIARSNSNSQAAVIPSDLLRHHYYSPTAGPSQQPATPDLPENGASKSVRVSVVGSEGSTSASIGTSNPYA
jgi:hypothetical protein